MITTGENFISPVLSLYTDVYFSYHGGEVYQGVSIPGGEYTRGGDTRGDWYTSGVSIPGVGIPDVGIPGGVGMPRTETG